MFLDIVPCVITLFHGTSYTIATPIGRMVEALSDQDPAAAFGHPRSRRLANK